MQEIAARSLCILSICCFNFDPFWFPEQGLGSGCASSWSLLTLYFYHDTVSKGRLKNDELSLQIVVGIGSL